MDMTLALLWLIGLFGFVLGLIIGHLWGTTEPRHERTSWDAPSVPMPNGSHVLGEVKEVVEQPLPRYAREVVQVLIEQERKGTMW